VDLRQYLRLARRWWWLVVAGALILAVPAYLVTRSQPKLYQATALVFVNVVSNPGTIDYSDALLSQQLVQSYSQMVQQPVMLEEVRTRLNLPYSALELAGMVHGEPQRDTQLFSVAVVGRDPQQITDIANATVEAFIEQQTNYLPESQRAGAIQIAQPALVPGAPIAPHPARNTILFGFLGLLVACAFVYVYEYLDDTVKSSEDLEEAASLATIGSVRDFRRDASSNGAANVALTLPSPEADAFRLIRTNLEFAAVGRPLRTLLITSSNPREGKSTTSANLAVALAQAEKRVILVDADLRKPALHRLFGLPNRQGLSNLIATESRSIDDCLQETALDGLRLLSSGPLPPNPVDLLSSARMRAVLDALTDRADVIIIDSPPVLAVADPIVLAWLVDGTLFVVDTSRTRAETLRDATEAIAKSGTRLLGAVLNKLKRGADGYDYYRAGYYEYTENANGSTTGRDRERLPPARPDARSGWR
jgi:capsular exopolysaccharide synthesis family protein